MRARILALVGVGCAWLMAGAHLASANPPTPPAATASSHDASPALSKKDRLLIAKREAQAADPDASREARKRWQKLLGRRIGKKPAPVISIYNTWTSEFIPVAEDSPLHDDSVPVPRINDFLRCHFTNQPASMDPRLFAALVAAARHFGVDRVDIVSGFRSPKYNLILRKKGREVARQSEHTMGHAVDFRLPGVSVKKLHAWARSLGLGGVGYYPSSGFVHIDTGRVRYWNGD